jgi:hypothetical protein
MMRVLFVVGISGDLPCLPMPGFIQMRFLR